MPLKKSPVSYKEFRQTGEVRRKEHVEEEPQSSPQPKLHDDAPQTNRTPEPARGEPTPLQAPSQELPKAAGEPRKAPAPRKNRSASTGEKNERTRTTISIVVPFPQKGVSKTFDILCQNYRHQKALALILRKALALFEDDLRKQKKSIPDTYPTQDGVLHTTRAMSEDAYLLAKQKYDPLDMLPNATFGRQVAQAALASYFKNEKAN